MKEPDLYNLVLISKGKETGIAKRRLVHDGSRLTKRLPEHPKQNIKICAHHPLTVFKGVSVDARTVKFSGKL